MVIEKTSPETKKIPGLGIAITGLIDNTEAIVQYSSNLRLSDFPLKDIVEEKVNIPVYLINGANAGVLGVNWYLRNNELLPPNMAVTLL